MDPPRKGVTWKGIPKIASSTTPAEPGGSGVGGGGGGGGGGGTVMRPPLLATAREKVKGGLSSDRLMEARNSWRKKRMARLEGAKKQNPPEEIDDVENPIRRERSMPDASREQESGNKGKHKLRLVKSGELRRLFGLGHDGRNEVKGSGQEDSEQQGKNQPPPPVPSPEEPFGEKVRRRASVHSTATGDDSHHHRHHISEETRRKLSLAGPRERLTAARASRELEKGDFGEVDLRRRRRRRSRQRSSDTQNTTGSDSSRGARRDLRAMSESTRRRQSPSPQREQLHAIEVARASGKLDYQTDNNQLGNAMRTEKAAYRGEGGRDAVIQNRPSPAAGRPGERTRYIIPRPPSRVPSSSSSGSPLEAPNPPYAMTASGNSTSRMPPANLQFRPEGAIPQPPLSGAPPAATPRNRIYQQVFPTRPAPPSYRPTLSPVSSRSPIPTNSVLTSRPSPKPEDATVGGSLAVPNARDGDGRDYNNQPEGDPSKRLSPLSPKTETAPAPKRSAMRQPNEPPPLRRQRTYGRPSPLPIGHGVPQVTFAQAEAISPKNTEGFGRRLAATSPTLRHPTPDENDAYTTSPRYHKGATESDDESTMTPTASALAFWAAADASLAPSESASALPPNHKGEPPPDIWRDADKALDLRKGGPTMEEWIASLPGLGLKLGPWAADGTLDSKMLSELREEVKPAKNEPSVDASPGDNNIRAVLVEKVKEMDNKIHLDEEFEEFVPEDVEGLLPEEVKVLEAVLATEPIPDNLPPPIADPTLLHPEYRSSLSAITSAPEQKKATIAPPTNSSSSSSSRRRNSVPTNPRRLENNLGGDVAHRLDALEKYWDEQGIVVGAVLKRMLWIVDTLIVKEREEAQRALRRKEMGWEEEDEKEEEEEEDVEELASSDSA